MNEMYNRIEALCKTRGINVTQMCKDTEIPRGNLTDLKKGRTAALATKTLSKIAAYFGVSMDYLLGGQNDFSLDFSVPTTQLQEYLENKKTHPCAEVSEQQIMAAFFNGADPDMTNEEMAAMWEDAKEYFRFKIAQRKKQRNDQ